MTQAHIRRAAGVGLLRRAWLKIREPRVVAVVHAITYLVLMTGGIAALIQPPTSISGEIGAVSMTLLAGMLTGGGLIGLVTVLPGWWWVERYGVALIIAACLIYGWIVSVLHVVQAGNRLLQLSIVLGLVGHLIIRLIRIKERPYDPTRRRRR